MYNSEILNLCLKMNLKKMLNELRVFKFVITLILKSKKIIKKTKCNNFYSNSKAETIIQNINIDSICEWYDYDKNIKKFSDKNINISKHKPIHKSSYIKLLKELWNLNYWKGWINIQNTNENKFFKCRLVRYLNLVRMNKIDKHFLRKFVVRHIKLPVKIRDICTINRRECISIWFFDYENKENFPIYV